MKLNPVLLDNSRGLIEDPGDLNACLNSRGLYNQFQFVLRLSPVVHRKLATLPTGIVSVIDPEGLEAYSTYLHETIHWWQHIGSTAGLMLSLSYPAQTHANYGHLTDYLETIGPKKSIVSVAELLTRKGKKNEAYKLANTIVNNHFDIEFFRVLSNHPKLVNEVLASPYFECIGHSYQIAYGNILQILADTLDRADGALPNPSAWSKPFSKRRTKKVKGFYHGSEIRVSSVGARALFEGQARFSQLQFLFFSSGNKLSWEDFKSSGFLDGVYVEAFSFFLNLTGLQWPPSPDHSIIALFLLVCDIAINPGVGFPFPVTVYETFVDDLDPGMRFIFLCLEIKKQPVIASMIRRYSKEEYIEVSEKITRGIYIHSPLAVAREAAGWISKSNRIATLMREYQTFEYSKVNLPIRVLFSHFLSFCQDKVLRPDFFCWPGFWSTGDRAVHENFLMFDKHSALFRDKEDDDGIFAKILKGKKDSDVQEMFNSFYSTNVMYDMTRQWITMKGPFLYNYRWLSVKKHFDPKGFADGAFEMAFKVLPDDFTLI